jgi:hypothetical protein
MEINCVVATWWAKKKGSKIIRFVLITLGGEKGKKFLLTLVF